MNRRQSFLAVALISAVSLLLPSTSSRAQVLYGSVVGNVTDERVVPGATVRVINVGTRETRETATNDAGTFSFPDLPSGTYDIVVSKQGFKTSTTRGVVVSVDKVARVNASLHSLSVLPAWRFLDSQKPILDRTVHEGALLHDSGSQQDSSAHVS